MKANQENQKGVKLTKEVMTNMSYQQITKAYKVVTGKAFRIGMKKEDFFKELNGKFYEEPVLTVKETAMEQKRQEKIAVKKAEVAEKAEERVRQIPDWKRIVDSRMKVNFNKPADLMKIVLPTKELYDANWNKYLTAPFVKNEKVRVHENQKDVNVEGGYVRVIHNHGKNVSVMNARHFYNPNQKDPSVLVDMEDDRIKAELNKTAA